MPNGSGSGVVIDASLNASAMESAINMLVADVDSKMTQLAGKFDESITKMENALNRMKNTSKNTTTEQNTQEIQSVSHLGESYDKLASAMQAAANQSARRWDVSPIQSYRMQLHELESEMNRLQNVSWNQGMQEWRNVGRQIDETRAKIQQLVQEQERLKSMPTANRFEEQQRLQQYQQLGVQIEELRKKEAELTRTHDRLLIEFAKETPAGKQLEQVKSQYDAVQQKIRDMGTSMQQETSLQAQKTQELEKQEQLLQKQVDSSKKISESGLRSSGTGTYEIGSIAPLSADELQRVVNAREADHAALQKEIQSTQQLDSAQRQLNATQAKSLAQQKPSFSTYDDMRSAIASVLGMEREQVRIADQTTSSYNRLNLSLGQMTEAYHRLGAEQRNSGMGKNLANEIQLTKRAIQEVQTQMMRPVSLKAALGNPEKTLDDIIYKMQQLSSYRLGINVEGKGVPKEIQDVNTELERLEKRKKELLNQNQQVVQSNNALTRSFNYMKNRLAFYFTVGASTQFVKNLIEIRAQYELLEKSIGILVGSMQEGSRIFSELNAMAIKSPFTTMELGAAAKQLTAYDVAAKDVVNTTKRLADMAAAVGVPIERLSYALGQVKAYDYLNARDARMFANAGIPLVRELSNYYTELEGKMVSVADVYSRMKKRMISYNDTMAVVNKMTDEGGKFFNFQEKMAGTLKVQLANLTLAWNNMLNSIGKQNQGLITAPIAALKTLFRAWDDISKTLRNVVIALGIVKTAQIIYIANTRKMTVGTALGTATNWKFVDSLVAMRAGFTKLLTSPLTWWALLATVVVSAGMALWDANQAVKEFNKSIKEGAKQNVENIESFLSDYSEIRKKIESGETVDKSEATKAWESIKEQIELTSGASDIFIAKLMGIEDINKRVGQSFEYLETIKAVSAALEKMDDDTIKIQQGYSGWWNGWLLPDSLFQNIQDFTQAQQRTISNATKMAESQIALRGALGSSNDALTAAITYMDDASRHSDTLDKNLDKLNQSMIDFAQGKGWLDNQNAMDEFFGQIGKKIIQEGLDKGWEQGDVLNFQMKFEEYRSKASKEALEKRLDEEIIEFANTEDKKTRIAIKAQMERDQAQLDNWEDNNGRGRILWGEFCKWMNDEHSTEVHNMYNKLTANGTKAIDYQSAEWRDFVQKMSDKFAKEHKLSQDDVFNHLHKWVMDANKWSVFIDLIISTSGDGKSYYDTLTDLDKKADDAYNKRKRLRQRISELEKQGKRDSDDYKNAISEETTAQEEYNKAIKDGGHSRAAEADEKKKSTAARNANAASTRAQAKAESELQKALKEEIQLIDKAQKEYKDLTKAGLSRNEALSLSTSGFEKSIKQINSVFKKWNIEAFDLSKYAGVQNPREILNMLESQLKTIVDSGKAKPEEIKELEVKIKDLKLDAEKYDMKKITDGLNNELGKLKEEYELAVELDANPELGGVFADMMGLSKEDLEKLPRDYAQVMDKLQNIIDAELGSGVFDLSENLNKDDFDKWVESMGKELDSGFSDVLNKMREYANKVRLDETKKITQEWDKLLEKYAEYEYKRAQIQKETERDLAIARKKKAGKDIEDAIILRGERQLAKNKFEEFQGSAYWITATGDLSRLSNDALQMLIDKLWEYKKAAKNLDPKDIMRINNAMRKLRKEQIKNNPFSLFSIAMDEARERMEQFEPEIQDVERKIKELWAKDIDGGLNEEEQEKLKKLIELYKELVEAQNKVGETRPEDYLKSIAHWANSAKEITSSLSQIADLIGDEGLKKAVNIADDVIGNIEAAEKGAQAWGGWWGAIIGGVTDAIPKIFKWLDGDNSIVEQIKDSQIAVKKLELSYKELQYQVDKAYGTAKYGAQQVAIANKKLQLEELKNQLRLEESRSSKHRDEEAIISLKGQIIDLTHEIHDSTEEIVTDLLGISSVGDFAENLVSSMIEAFKQGEDYMKVFEESFEDMVDNMIMKAIVSRLIGDFINKIFDQVNANAQNRSQAQVAQAKIDEITKAQQEIEDQISFAQGMYELSARLLGENHQETQKWKNQLEEYLRQKQQLEQSMTDAINSYNEAIAPTPEDVNEIRDMVAQGKDGIKEQFKAFMDMFGISFGQGAGDAELSALQQGIQGITEDTAGALEAYMNGVSQQVYLHSDLLTQIRDILINFGGDVTIATNAQILLQLQQSFQVQMTIQNVLTGVLNASGLAFRVELAS